MPGCMWCDDYDGDSDNEVQKNSDYDNDDIENNSDDVDDNTDDKIKDNSDDTDAAGRS